MNLLPNSVKKLWRISGAATGAFLGLIVAGVLGAFINVMEFPEILYIALILPFAGGIALGVWWAGVKFRNWGWQITERWIEAKRGVLAHHRVVIPRNRIQTITTNSGPIDRMLDLETITVHTAGAGAPNLTIPHLGTATVREIRTALGQGVND